MFKKVLIVAYTILLGCLCAKVMTTDAKKPEYLKYVQSVEETQTKTKEKNYYINVGITNDNKKYFKQVSFTCDKDYIVETSSDKKTISAKKKVTYKPSDFQSGERVLLYSPSKNGINCLSLNRSFGHPSYLGKIALYFQKDKIYIVNRLELESYLRFVIPSEISANSEGEALKAQAVCARSYAFSALAGKDKKELTNPDAMKKSCDVWDSTDSQVYNKQLSSKAVKQAVKKTKGEVLVDCDTKEIIRTWYYSTSWGFTADTSIWQSKSKNYSSKLSGNLKKKEVPVLSTLDLNTNNGFRKAYNDWKSFDCNFYDQNMPWFRWRIETNTTQLTKNLAMKQKVSRILCKKRGVGGGVTKLEIQFTDGSKKTVTGMGRIREVLGSKNWKIKKMDGSIRTNLSVFPSAFFYIEQNKNKIIFHGGGFGHGVGLSQAAMKQMAKDGKKYSEILHFFYNNVKIQDINE